MIRLSPTRKNFPSINLTPLVDVVFLLLIFFLLTAFFIKPEGMEINLPKTQSPLPGKAGEITITVKASGRILLEGEEVDLSGLESRLRKMLAGRDSAAVVVQADREVFIQRVVSVMERAKRAGGAQLILATEALASEAADENVRE